MLPDIRSLTREELTTQFQAWDLPTYRLDQVLTWLYLHRATTWEEMTNLPKALRAQLQTHYAIRPLDLLRQQGAQDTTRKFLWRLHDGALVESVLIPANPALYGEASDRHTLCVSTQVGCAYGCRFCASGLDGWKRNLLVEEIVEQVLAVERGADAVAVAAPQSSVNASAETGSAPVEEEAKAAPDRLVNNLVIMGMGEPLANYDNLLKALRILNAPWGGRLGARKITISTSGLAPQIRKLADEPFQFRLAISLHGATDPTRDRIMPINRRYPLRELTSACEYYEKQKGRMITLEYILIAGVNDGLAEIRPLAILARRLHAKVNLIPYNHVQGLQWKRPDEETQEKFLAALQAEEIPSTLRREKGHDIDAACGQLRLRTERQLAGQAG
jgi:23S rRNA (adenine2503-C2)-methyltransferase